MSDDLGDLADLAVINDHPDLSIPKTFCPHGCHGKVVRMQTMSTALGGDPDPNHYWVSCRCQECGEDFTKEHKYQNVWYTKKGRVLLGRHSCFESYIYACRHCGGDVTRQHMELDGKTAAASLSWDLEAGGMTAQFRTFYRCAGCKEQVEVEPNG